MDAAVVASLFERLSKESQVSVYDYIQYLADREGQRKANRARRAFERVDALLDGDTGWTSEEEMLTDLAESRRKEIAHAKQPNRTH